MNKDLLYKYFNGQASEAEVTDILEEVQSSPHHKKEFLEHKKLWALLESCQDGKEQVWQGIEGHLKAGKTRRSPMWKIAATILLFLGLGAGLQWILSDASAVDSNGVVLELPGGKQEVLLSGEHKFLVNEEGSIIAEQKEDRIVFRETDVEGEPQEQTIRVPYGKTYRVSLSDGTKVHLNAGSTLVFPEQFPESLREVSITGEAYFEVAKDQSKPFIVNTDKLSLRVLGTIFNLSAYPGEDKVETLLVEGSVELEATNQKVILEPMEFATWSQAEQSFQVVKAEPLRILGWRRGEIIFKNVSSSEMFDRLERAYGAEIVNHNSTLDRQMYTGSFELKEISLPEILDLLKLDTPFSYSVTGNTYTIHSEHK